MSTDLLCRAAALMREDAEFTSPALWHVTDDNRVWDRDENLVVASDVDIIDRDLDHIASWHPAVALAVADLLTRLADRAADIADTIGSSRVADDVVTNNLPGYREALAVATAYLGEQP